MNCRPQWFATNFGLDDPREVVALMGAHTLGGLNEGNSLMKYNWNRGEHAYFNNEYYKSMTGETDHLVACFGDKLALIGDKEGNPARRNWRVRGRNWMEDFGPYVWRKQLDLCFDGGIGNTGIDKMKQGTILI